MTVAVDLPEGRRLNLKTPTRPEARERFRFQAGRLLRCKGAAGVVVPGVLRSLTGEAALSDREAALIAPPPPFSGAVQARLRVLARRARPQCR